jgi:sec-independent protein translocase protein TatA
VPNIGLPEIIIVLVIALVVFGPRRLPEMGRQIGKAIREFRTATSEIRTQMGVDDITDTVKDIKSDFSLTGADKAAGSGGAGAAAAPGAPGAAAPAPASSDAAPDDTPGADRVAHYIAPGITTADLGAGARPAPAARAPDAETGTAAAAETGTAAAAETGTAAAADAVTAAATGEADDDVGVEAFGSLTRRSARPSAG